MSFDEVVVRRHLLALDEALQTLRAHQGKPVELLRTNHEERWAVERGLQLCAQNALDIATHLAVAAGRDVPDYAAGIERLVEIGILSAEFASRFKQIAGFRNILVHGYLDVDVVRLHRFLNELLDDFVEFARSVHHFFPRSTP